MEHKAAAPKAMPLRKQLTHDAMDSLSLSQFGSMARSNWGPTKLGRSMNITEPDPESAQHDLPLEVKPYIVRIQ